MTVISDPKPRRRYGDAWTAGAVDFATGTHARAIAVLVVVTLFAFLPGFFHIPPVDRDEARFAQATKQMLETGDYVDIRFQDEARYKKPVGIYWLQAAVVDTAEALGVPKARTTHLALSHAFAARRARRRAADLLDARSPSSARRGAVLAGLLMATSVLLGVEARLAKTDAVLLFTVVAAMGALARAYLPATRRAQRRIGRGAWPAIFWTAMASAS